MKKVTTKSEKTTTEKAPVQPEVPQFEQKDRRGEVIKTNRFVIRKTLVGLGVLIEFTNKKGVSWRYDHDEVFYSNEKRFTEQVVWDKYGIYTQTHNVPAFGRSLKSTVMVAPEVEASTTEETKK
jgi:hypothetical protein